MWDDLEQDVQDQGRNIDQKKKSVENDDSNNQTPKMTAEEEKRLKKDLNIPKLIKKGAIKVEDVTSKKEETNLKKSVQLSNKQKANQGNHRLERVAKTEKPPE